MHGSTLPGFLFSGETLEKFLAAFFDRSLPKAEWTHAAHIALAAYVLYDADIETVLPRVRTAIRGYNEAVGGKNTDTSGYHETLTVFWLKVVAEKLEQLRPGSRLDAARGAVAAYGEARTLSALYYSTDIVNDALARREWVEPDLLVLS
jgi:hypothetical protein